MKTTRILIGAIVLLTLLAVALADLPSVSTSRPQPAPGAVRTVTPQYDYVLVRTVDANDTALTGTTKGWTSIYTKFKPIPQAWSSVRISCYADGDGSGVGDPNGGSFAWKLFACKYNGGAQLVAAGTWAIGEEALTTNPTTGDALTYGVTDPNSSKWGELPVVSNDYWNSVDAAGTSDDMGELVVDVFGSYGIWMEVTAFTGITNLRFVMTGF